MSVIVTMLTYTRHDETSKMALEGEINHLQKEEMISGSQSHDRLLFFIFIFISLFLNLLYGMKVLVVEVSEEPEHTRSQDLS